MFHSSICTMMLVLPHLRLCLATLLLLGHVSRHQPGKKISVFVLFLIYENLQLHSVRGNHLKGAAPKSGICRSGCEGTMVSWQRPRLPVILPFPSVLPLGNTSLKEGGAANLSSTAGTRVTLCLAPIRPLAPSTFRFKDLSLWGLGRQSADCGTGLSLNLASLQ